MRHCPRGGTDNRAVRCFFPTSLLRRRHSGRLYNKTLSAWSARIGDWTCDWTCDCFGRLNVSAPARGLVAHPLPLRTARGAPEFDSSTDSGDHQHKRAWKGALENGKQTTPPQTKQHTGLHNFSLPNGSGASNHMSFEGPRPCIGGSGTCNGGAHDP